MALPERYRSTVSVEADDLACSRGGRLVFAGLSFRLAPGQFLALVGPNGAGKSSLLRLVAGLLRADSGRISITADKPGEEGSHLHYLGHLDALKPVLSLAETLQFWTTLYTGKEAARPDLAVAAGAVGIGHALDLPVGVLSAGQRRRAGLARLILAPRPLWLLDEPSSALDRDGEALLGRLMQAHLTAGGAIIAATHGDLPVKPDAVLDFGHSA